MSDETRVACPSCDYPLRFRPEYVGRRVVCKHCQATFRFPDPNSARTRAEATRLESSHGTGTAFWEPKASSGSGAHDQNEFDRLNLYARSISRECETLRAEAVHARVELEETRQALAHLQTVEADFSTVRLLVEQLALEKEQAIDEISRLKTEIEKARQESDRQRSDIESQKRESLASADSFRLEVEDWKIRHAKILASHDDSSRGHEEARNKLQSEIEHQRGHNASLKSQLDQQESRHQAELEEMHSHEDALQTQGAETSTLRGEVERLNVDVARLKAEIEETERQHQSSMAELEEMHHSHEDALQTQGAESATLRCEVGRLNEYVVRLKAEIEEKESRHKSGVAEILSSRDESSKDHASQFSRLKAEVERLTFLNADLTTQLEQKERFRQAGSSDHDRAVGKSSREIDFLTATIAELEQRLDEETALRKAAESSVDELSTTLAATFNTPQRAGLGSYEKPPAEAPQELSEIKSQLDSLAAELRKKSEEAEGYKIRLTHAKAYREQLQSLMNSLGIRLPEN